MNKTKRTSSRRRRSASRYSAKLLFQFRVVVDGASSKRRICEERIVIVRAHSAKAALSEAKKLGRLARYSYRNSDGQRVHFEFVGIIDFLHLGVERQSNEVWYDVRQLLNPMERKKEIIPSDSSLLAKQQRANK